MKKNLTVSIEEYIENFYNGDISFEVKEAYKTVRTNIMFATNSIEGCKKLIITSSVPSEGKSTASVNLAISLAQIGAKILLVDADLRSPTVHKFLQLDRSVGLSSYLSNFNEFDEIITTTKYGFDCVVSGPIPPNPAELFSGDKIKTFFQTVNEKYDYVIVDTPPVNIVSDAALLSKYVDGIILVARNKYTAHPSVAKALKTLSFVNATVLGFLYNDKSITDESTFYMYGKRYGYKYRYRYKYGYGRKQKKMQKYGYYYGESEEQQ